MANNSRDDKDSDSGSPSPTDYDNFFELLGVSESVSEKTVEERARKLLGKFHPDVSDHPDADQIFKDINRAQDVLTDREQRAIYLSLGHDEYINRREEGGEMTMSDDITSGDSFTPSTKNKGGSTGDGQSGLSADHGSTNRNERNTWAGRIREHGSYTSITDMDLGLTPQEVIQKFYRELWAARLTFVLMFAAGLLYLKWNSPSTILELWGSTGASTDYGIPGIIIVLTALFGMFVTVISGVVAYHLLKPIDEEITIETKEQAEKQEFDEERSRGLNTSTPHTSDTSSSSNSTSSWDVHSRYDTARNKRGVIQTDENKRRNWSLKQGKRFLFIAIIMAAFGAFMSGVHPLEHLYLLLTGDGVDAPLWVEGGSDGSNEVVVLFNIGYALIMGVVGLIGSISTAHGLSREVWYQRYFTDTDLLPFLWDTLIIGVVTAIGITFVLGTSEIPERPGGELPSAVETLLIANDGVTSIGLVVAGMVILYALTILFWVRKRFA